MPVYTNDLEDSPIAKVISCPTKDAASLAIEYTDGTSEMLEGEIIMQFIDKFTDAQKRGIKRTIGFHLEEKLRDEFYFLKK